MNKLDENILCKIFLHIDSLNELFQISSVCRQWRKLIIEKDFIQKRFILYRHQYLIYHYKFDNISNISFHPNHSFQTGHLQHEQCFLGSCLNFDAHSSITIPFNNYLSEQFSISVWIQNTSSVNSWRTIFDICLFESKCGFIHLGITPKSTIESQLLLFPNQTIMKCRSFKQKIVRYLWYHLVILISQDKQQLFINGHFQREIKRNLYQNKKIPIRIKELNIGTNSNGYNCWFGRIADLSIWNRWLHSMEIRAIWQQRVLIDRTNLGEYLINNFNTKQLTSCQSVLF